MGHGSRLKHGIILEGFNSAAPYGEKSCKKNRRQGNGNDCDKIAGFVCLKGFVGQTVNTFLFFTLSICFLSLPALNQAVFNPDDPVRKLRQLRIVSDHYDGLAEFIPGHL